MVRWVEYCAQSVNYPHGSYRELCPFKLLPVVYQSRGEDGGSGLMACRVEVAAPRAAAVDEGAAGCGESTGG